MSEDNPYRAPEADLIAPGEATGGSIENTLAGGADLDLSGVMGEAWDRTDGIKGIVVVTGLALIVISVVASGILQLILSAELAQLVVTLLLYPIMAGLFVVGLRQSVDLPVDYSIPFNYFHLFLTLAAIGLLQWIGTTIGMLLLILPGIYLSIALSLAIPLHVEKKLSVIESMTTSLQIINQKFVTVALLAIIASVLLTLGFITLIGWIWAAPWALMVYCITYRQLAGTSLSE